MDDARAKLDWFKTVVLPHQPALRARLRRLTRDSVDLDDLVSEVLTRAFASSGWRTIDYGRAFLFTVARNLVIDRARRDKVACFVQMHELDILHAGYELEPQLCARDELRRLQLVIDDMPRQCRRVFLLRRLHDKSMIEIADEMGLSVSTVEKHLGKAIKLIMRALAEQEESAICAGDKAEGASTASRSRRYFA